MAIYELFKSHVFITHKSTLCSNATLFIFLTTAITLIAPFLIVYRSNGFWLRVSTFREQPEVLFKHQYILVAETDRFDEPVVCTTYSTLSYLLKESDMCSLVKSREIDSNDDGKFDELNVEFFVQLDPERTVYSVKLILIFDYKLHKMNYFQMESMGFIHYTSSLPGAHFDVIADLHLIQREPLNIQGRHLEYNVSIINSASADVEAFDLKTILKNYAKRNVSTIISNIYPVWTTGLTTDTPFQISVVIHYPEETIMYKPRFWQVMKWAWIQYFSVLIIFICAFNSIKSYVFHNQIVSSIKIVPWKKVW